MNINFKNIFYYLTLAIVLISCDQKEEVDYTPKVSAMAPAITVSTSNVTDNSFDVEYTAQGGGILYYAIQLSSASAPEASSIIEQSSGSLVNLKADLTSSSALSYSMNTDIYGGYGYSIYSVMTSTDGIASSVIKTDVTTPDSADPMFLGDASSPAFQSGGISPFAPVTLTFSEPVFYQGGDITFQAFGSGRTITVNDASALSMSGASISVDTHGTFELDDFIIVSWADGTFKDNADKSVAALSGFSHYFKTRLFTAPEAAGLMVGTYNYEAVMYGGNIEDVYTANAPLFLATTGEYELKLDPSDATGSTLLGINVFSPLVNYGYAAPANLKIRFGEEGVLAILDEAQTSGLPFSISTTWTHYSSGLTTAEPGYYDVTAGTINQYLSISVTDTNQTFDDIDYNYTRVGTYAKSTPKTQKELKAKREQHKAYNKIDLKVLNIVK